MEREWVEKSAALVCLRRLRWEAGIEEEEDEEPA